MASGFLCGVTGFLVSSIFVDSTLGVTVTFYALLGLGIYTTEYLMAKRRKSRTNGNGNGNGNGLLNGNGKHLKAKGSKNGSRG